MLSLDVVRGLGARRVAGLHWNDSTRCTFSRGSGGALSSGLCSSGTSRGPEDMSAAASPVFCFAVGERAPNDFATPFVVGPLSEARRGANRSPCETRSAAPADTRRSRGRTRGLTDGAPLRCLWSVVGQRAASAIANGPHATGHFVLFPGIKVQWSLKGPGSFRTAQRCKRAVAIPVWYALQGSVCSASDSGGVGTRPWWLALLACGGAYWPLALEPSAMTSRHPHCRGHPPAWGGIQNATSAHGVLP